MGIYCRGKKLKGKSGATLIEVLIALAVAGMTIFPLLFMFPKMKMVVEVAHHKTAAIRACQAKVEEVRRLGFSNVLSGNFPTQELVILDQGNAAVATDDIRSVVTTSMSDIFSGGVLIAKKILVQCQWRESSAVVNEYLDFILYRNIA